jgi:hypothetical protein
LTNWKAEAKAKRAEIREQHKHEGVPISLFAHGCFTNFNTILLEIGMGTESDDEDYDAPVNWLRAADVEADLDALELTQVPEAHQSRQPEAGPSRSSGTSSEVGLSLCLPKNLLTTSVAVGIRLNDAGVLTPFEIYDRPESTTSTL